MTTLETLLRDADAAGGWNLVTDRSTIAFATKSMWGLMPVKGTFTDFSGEGGLTGQGAVSGRLDIRAASVETGITKRDTHLRSADFFDVARFPDISVVVTGLHPGTGRFADLQATLTVKGVTKPLPLTATVTGLDDGTVQISAQADIDRTQWDVTGNQLGMVGKTTKLVADVVFLKSR